MSKEPIKSFEDLAKATGAVSTGSFNVDGNGHLIWDDALERTLDSVNKEVNRNTNYRRDIDLYGKSDFWTIAEGSGDCEDYALAKRLRLLALGVPYDCLCLATCWVEPPSKEYHAVLIVRTTKGDFVLDNRHISLKRWSSLGYLWHKVQLPKEKRWYFIAGAEKL